MADVDLSVIDLNDNERTALALVAMNSSDTYKYVNTGKEKIYIESAAGAGRTLTIVTTQTVEGLAVPDRAISIADGEQRVIPPRAAKIYNDPTDAKVSLTVSGTGLSIAVFR